MIESMTGFGNSTRKINLGGGTSATISVDCRSVNSRFLDISVRCPEECRLAEYALRELTQKYLQRGKVEFRINIQREEHGGVDSEEKLNVAAVEHLLQLQSKVQAIHPNMESLRVGEVLRWPGVLKEAAVDEDVWHGLTLELAQASLDALKTSRRHEGQALADLILQRATAIRSLVRSIEPKIPEILAAHQAKLSLKLTELLDATDTQGKTITKDEIADRIRQEVVLYGVRIDVAEELNRINTHLDAVEAALSKGGPVGKRLDFLMQELNREANTLGSKSVAQETSSASVEMKLLIEQMREQIQNLE